MTENMKNHKMSPSGNAHSRMSIHCHVKHLHVEIASNRVSKIKVRIQICSVLLNIYSAITREWLSQYMLIHGN